MSRLLALLGLLALVLAPTLVPAASADPASCQQAYSTLAYSYDPGATVPDGALTSDAAQSADVFGASAGQPGCQDFTNRLDARKTTLTDTADTTQNVQVLVTGFDASTLTADACTLTVAGTTYPTVVVPDSNGITATLATGTDPNGDLTEPYTGSFADYTVDTPQTIPVTVDCGTLGVFHPDLVVNATPDPSGTTLTASTATARTAVQRSSGRTVSGRLRASRRGFSVTGQPVLIQHWARGHWSKIARVVTGSRGRYSVTVSDTTHRLRAKYVASLRLLGSVS